MKKFISIFTAIITIFSSAGCKGTKQEAENLAVVLLAGFDLTDGNKYMVTVQILNTQKDSSSKQGSRSSAGQQIPSDVLIYSTIGNSPTDAVKNLSTQFGKNLFWSHSKATILGKELAESGVALFFDASLRGYMIRPDIPLLVTKGKACNIVSTITKDDKIPANVLDSLMKTQKIIGLSPVVSRLDFANALISKTAAPVAGVIELNKEEFSDSAFKLAGTSVFKKDKLIGYLDVNQTRGMQWVNGKVKSGNIFTVDSDNKTLIFEILTASSKVKPILKKDSIIMQINIKEEGNIRELANVLDPMENYKIMNDLNKLQKEAIENEIKLALNAAQKDLKADIFDFGGAVRRSYPEFWKNIESNWEDIFPTIEVEINVNSNLERPGIISKPLL